MTKLGDFNMDIKQCVQQWLNKYINSYPNSVYFGKDEKGECWVFYEKVYDYLIEDLQSGDNISILFYNLLDEIYPSDSAMQKKLWAAINWILGICAECNTSAIERDVVAKILQHWGVEDALGVLDKSRFIRLVEK